MNRKKGRALLFTFLTVVFVSFVTVAHYVTHGFSWRQREFIRGIFIHEKIDGSELRLYFPLDEGIIVYEGPDKIIVQHYNSNIRAGLFWANHRTSDKEGNIEIQRIAQGTYRHFAERRKFEFVGEDKGEFRDFSVANRRVDIDVHINGEILRFQRRAIYFTEADYENGVTGYLLNE